jgi:flagellar biosynthesis anti-sigma factor FlgM
MKVEKRSLSSSFTAVTAGAAYTKSQKKVNGSAKSRDSVDVSPSANLFTFATEAVRQVPDIRTDAIEGIQQEVRDGSYYRDEEEVADRVLQDHLNSPL